MRLATLLDDRKFARLGRSLDRLLADAPENGLISVTLTFGEGVENWLPSDLCQADALYWSQPAQGIQSGVHRLALGRAIAVTSAGAARFTALQAGFNGLAPAWLHDDCEATGISPAAHLGFAFEDDTRDELPNARLCVPAILLRNEAKRSTATFSCAVRDSRNVLAVWRETLRAASTPPPYRGTAHGPQAIVRRATPLVDQAFLARAQAALTDIAQGGIRKVVLTRLVRFASERAIPVASLLAALADRLPQCTIYGAGQSGAAFVGATPERLVALDDGVVCADALAGTAWLSAISRTTRPGSLTLHGEKNSHEQQLVVDAVRDALAPLCASLDPPQTPEIMQLRELQHLRTRIAGRLRPEVDFFDLLARLHPTPAVGGTPTGAARHWLLAHGERRGAWYTGGIGWIDRKGNGEVVVPLRCARIEGRHADLFAGAGIVAGSDPQQELAETEVKLGAMLDALQYATGSESMRAPDSGRTATA